MTWIDWLIIAVFGLLIFKGFRKGFVQQLFDLIGSIVALILAFRFNQSLGLVLSMKLGLSEPLANMISFILIVVIIGGLVSIIGRIWHRSHKTEPIAVIDGSLGAVFGAVKAALIMMVVLLLLLAIPWDFIQEPIKNSDFANDLLRLTPVFLKLQNLTLPADFPRMVISANGVKWLNLDYSRLGVATCFACGGKVKYNGLVKAGLLHYPQTICMKCGRVSDGCLTFEGYHMLHQCCPYEKIGVMGTTDCKIWTNPEPAKVKGKCPVCGRTR